MKVRLIGYSSRHLQDQVSIHAPVKVRLVDDDADFVHAVVSIHAPVKVRPVTLTTNLIIMCFNSRTREGATQWQKY